MKTVAQRIKDGIEGKFLQKFDGKDGKKYELSAQIDVMVKDSEEEAAASGADNVAELGYGRLIDDKDGPVGGLGFSNDGESFDRMVLPILPGLGGGTFGDFVGEIAAHEFGAHLLAATHSGDSKSLFFGDGGKGRFLQSDFERMFGSRNPNLVDSPPPMRGVRTYTDYTQRIFSRVMTSNHGGIESRRAVTGLERTTYHWIQEVKR